MIKSFVDKIPQSCRIAIFGAGNAGRGLRKYIKQLVAIRSCWFETIT